jgi:hypothetical protein
MAIQVSALDRVCSTGRNMRAPGSLTPAVEPVKAEQRQWHRALLDAAEARRALASFHRSSPGREGHGRRSRQREVERWVLLDSAFTRATASALRPTARARGEVRVEARSRRRACQRLVGRARVLDSGVDIGLSRRRAIDDSGETTSELERFDRYGRARDGRCKDVGIEPRQSKTAVTQHTMQQASERFGRISRSFNDLGLVEARRVRDPLADHLDAVQLARANCAEEVVPT